MARYKYGMRLRGFSPMCQPMNGLIGTEEDPNGRYYDILVYDRQLASKEAEAYELDFIGKEQGAMKYWITDCISGVYGEEDAGEGFTSLEEARTECEIMNRQAVKEGHRPDFWIIVDEDGEQVV